MDSSFWSWVAIAALLVLCCLPMLFMGRRGKDMNKRGDADKSKHDGDKSS